MRDMMKRDSHRAGKWISDAVVFFLGDRTATGNRENWKEAALIQIENPAPNMLVGWTDASNYGYDGWNPQSQHHPVPIEIDSDGCFMMKIGPGDVFFRVSSRNHSLRIKSSRRVDPSNHPNTPLY